MNKTRAYKLEHTGLKFFDKGNLLDLGKRFFTKYGHAAQLTKVDGVIKQSHMWGKHQIDAFGFENTTHSDIFRLNVSKLVNKTQEADLRENLGENWQQELQKLYAEKVAAVSQNTALDKARIIGGKASIQSLYPHRYGRIENEYHGLFFQSDTEAKLYKDNMICSDFVAREICEAINLVNRDLQGMGLGNAIKSPFPSYVNLSRVHPEELIVLLERARCIDKIEPKMMSSLINTRKNYTSLLDHQEELTKALYNTVFKLAQKCETEDDFVKEATLKFKGYLYSNDLLKYEKLDEIDAFLVQPLKNLYKHHDSKNTMIYIRSFCELFKKFIHFVGYTNKESITIIESTVDSIKAQTHTVEIPSLLKPV